MSSSLDEKKSAEATPSIRSTSKEALKEETGGSPLLRYSAEEEASLVRKIDWKLLPGLTFLYLLSFLDRSNVGNAKL